MNGCRRLRIEVTSKGEQALSLALQRHLATCESCTEYSARLRGARAALAGHLTVAAPDAGFARRVRAHLPRDPAEALGGAALKLLPVTLVLALALTWLTLREPPTQSRIDAENDAQILLSWVLTDQSEGR